MTAVLYEPTRLRITASGHAGFATKGSDTVCAAVTALMATLPAAFEDAGITHAVTSDEEKGVLQIRAMPPPGGEGECMIMMNTVAAGLSRLAEAYPENVSMRTLTEREVKG